jgi:large subunit ribosomal protein L18
MIRKARSERKARIKQHIQKKVRGTTDRPRLTVYRSLHHIYAQVVDDTQSKVLASVSTLSKDVKTDITTIKGRMAKAKHIGKLIAEKAKGKNIRKVVFDRSGYLYHGVVKAIADGAREGGLEF